MDATEKTLSVLDALNGPSRLGDIAERAQLPKPTVHRILRRLVEGGWARAEGGGVYALGPRVLAMAGAMLHALDAGTYALPILRELHAEVGHTVHFAVHTDDQAIYLEKLVDPDLPYQFASRIGGRIQLHSTAIGKAVLAALDPVEADELVSRIELTRRTPQTITTPAALRRSSSSSVPAGSRSTTRRTSATSAVWARRCAITAAGRRTRSACLR